MDTTAAPTIERRLGGALEPVIGQVYFSPECHANYEALGFAASPGQANGVALPDGPAYFTSRGSVMGQVRGNVVASAFAVFNPAAVIPAVDHGWTLTNAAEICDARDRGAIDQLARCVGEDAPGAARIEALLIQATDGLDCTGRPLAAGIQNLSDPGGTFGTIFRRGDLLREYRGDSHTIAWVSAGLSAVEMGLLTELYWGLPPRSYSRTRAWSDAQFDVAQDALTSRGLLDANGGLTDDGRAYREAIEVETDRHMAPVLRALGEDIDELIDLLAEWGRRVRAGGGYLASGPHDLAERGKAL